MDLGHKAGHTKYLDSARLTCSLSGISSIVAVMDGTGCFTCAFPPLWHGWNWMLHMCLSGISSIVAVMDGTGST